MYTIWSNNSRSLIVKTMVLRIFGSWILTPHRYWGLGSSPCLVSKTAMYFWLLRALQDPKHSKTISKCKINSNYQSISGKLSLRKKRG